MKGGANTGVIEWTVPERPRESQGGSLRRVKCLSPRMSAYCSVVFQGHVLYMSPKGSCCQVTHLPFLCSLSVVALRIDEWIEGNRLPVIHVSARSFFLHAYLGSANSFAEVEERAGGTQVFLVMLPLRCSGRRCPM